jgi:uncharacterized protein YjbI with pentapeptide repeats
MAIIVNGYTIEPGAYLVGAQLQGAQIQSAILGGVDLSGAFLQGANLTWANLTGAKLRGADLRGADLRGAGLEGADLRGAFLRNADLRGADLAGADLRGAFLQDANLEGTILQKAPPRELSAFLEKINFPFGADIPHDLTSNAVAPRIAEIEALAIKLSGISKQATPGDTVAKVLDRKPELTGPIMDAVVELLDELGGPDDR